MTTCRMRSPGLTRGHRRVDPGDVCAGGDVHRIGVDVWAMTCAACGWDGLGVSAVGRKQTFPVCPKVTESAASYVLKPGLPLRMKWEADDHTKDRRHHERRHAAKQRKEPVLRIVPSVGEKSYGRGRS